MFTVREREVFPWQTEAGIVRGREGVFARRQEQTVREREREREREVCKLKAGSGVNLPKIYSFKINLLNCYCFEIN